MRALVRDPTKLNRTDDKLIVVRGDVTDPAAVAETVAGADLVISLFGQVKGSPKTLQTDGIRVIVEAMKAAGVPRIVTLSGGGLRDPHDQPKLADWAIQFLLKALSGHVLADAEGHLEVLKSSGLDWTVVHGPRLTEEPGTGTYRQGWVGVGTGTAISRDDLADFILTQVEDDAFIGRMPFVSN